DFLPLERREIGKGTDEQRVVAYLLDLFGISLKESLILYNETSMMVTFTSTNKKDEYTEILFARREGTEIRDPVYIRFDPESDEGTPSVYMLKDGKVEQVSKENCYVFTTNSLSTNKEVGIIIKTGEATGLVYFYFELEMEENEETINVPALLATPFDSLGKIDKRTAQKLKRAVEKGFREGGPTGSLISLSEAVNEYIIKNNFVDCGVICSFGGYEGHTDYLTNGIEHPELFPYIFVVPLSVGDKRSSRAIKEIIPPPPSIKEGKKNKRIWENVVFRVQNLPQEVKARNIDDKPNSSNSIYS
ncbi:MAG: hypothetical protein ACP5IK_01040, partial [Candidatus Micrarchaeia archaeon]